MVHTRSFVAVVDQTQNNIDNNTNTRNEILEIGQIDAFHPYYLHPSDHPSLLLVNQQLAEKNYNQWRRVMTIAHCQV